MLKRTITGLLAAAYVIAMILLGRTALLINLGLLLLIGTHEMLGTLKNGGFHPVRWIYYVYAAALLPAYVFGGQTGLMVAVLVGMLISMASAALTTEPDAKSLLGALLPAFYPTLPIMAMTMLVNSQSAYWRMLVWLMFALSAGSDCFALYVGSAFGKHKLIPKVSPNKTVEGAVGGFAGAVGVALIVYAISAYNGDGLPVWLFLGLGAVGALSTQVGDIVASYIKRFCGVKDFGRIFPGHGGLLDRLDGIMYNAVGLWIFAVLTGI